MKSTTSRTLAALGLGATLLLTACGDSDGDGGGTAVGEDCTPAHPDLETVADGTLTVSVNVSPPYTMEADGGFEGVDGEIIARIAEMECLTLKADAVAAAGLIQSVQSARADSAMGEIYRTPEREEILNLSATAYRDGMAVISTEPFGTLEELQGKKVGSIQGYLWTEDFQKALGGDNVTIYQSSDGMAQDLNNGRIDAAILTTAEAAYRVTQDGGDLVATDFEATPDIAASEQPGEVVFPTPKENTALAEAISADIQTLQEDGTIEEILKKYELPESSVVTP